MLSKCCCCVELRTGSIVLGILGILGGVGQFAQGLFWGNILNGIFYLIAYGALLFGAIKYNPVAVLVNLICTIIIIVLGIILGIWILAAGGIAGSECRGQGCAEATGVVIAGGVGCLIGAALNAYFWVCNYSFYKELKEGNANPA